MSEQQVENNKLINQDKLINLSKNIPQIVLDYVLIQLQNNLIPIKIIVMNLEDYLRLLIVMVLMVVKRPLYGTLIVQKNMKIIEGGLIRDSR